MHIVPSGVYDSLECLPPGRENLNDPHEIYKDLDLKSSFRLDDGWRERLEYQIRADTALLESCQVQLWDSQNVTF
jgi:hypothetical protein